MSKVLSPDERCTKSVRTEGTNFRHHQCKRGAVKDGFCLQHHPDTVDARRKASDDAFKRKHEQSIYGQYRRALERVKVLETTIENVLYGIPTDYQGSRDDHGLLRKADVELAISLLQSVLPEKKNDV